VGERLHAGYQLAKQASRTAVTSAA
jgi:hypothetical protein